MAGFAESEVEILVHTTAPSRGQDDAHYRALARAYLEFQPAEIHRWDVEPERDVEPETESQEDVDIQADSQLQEELEHSILVERESEASYRPDDGPESQSVAQFSASARPQGLDSPVLSFNSALDNADSPVWRNLERGWQHKTQSSWKGQPSEIADSQPENDKTIPEFSSPTRILELYLQQIQSSGERSSSCYGIDKNPEQTVAPSPDLPYIIQHCQSPILGSAKTCTSLAKRKWPESSLDDSHTSSPAPKRLSFERSIVTTRTSRARKRQCMDGSVDEITKMKEITSSKVTIVSSAPSFESQSIWAERLEIRPPPPRTSIADLTPDTLITSHLYLLAQKMPLGVLFRPKEQLRDLRPMERGHWIVKCENWDLGVRKRCWECLGNFIGKGKAGWVGVSVVRDEELRTFKLFCWGNIVGHAYLLLLAASESKLKGTRACWIGGNGEVIIKMPG